MSLGSFLKRATTIPKHGILSPLRKVFGSTPLDEIGAVGGFLVGGPGGAAAGSGLGSLAHGASLGSALGNAAKYGAAGVGANAALGAVGGGAGGALANLGHDLSPVLSTAKGALGLAHGAGGAAGGGGGLLGSVLNFAKSNPELLLGGAGLVSGALGQHGADNARSEALALAREQQAQRAHLSAALLARMNNPTRPVSLSYRDPNNPFTG